MIVAFESLAFLLAVASAVEAESISFGMVDQVRGHATGTIKVALVQATSVSTHCQTKYELPATYCNHALESHHGSGTFWSNYLVYLGPRENDQDMRDKGAFLRL